MTLGRYRFSSMLMTQSWQSPMIPIISGEFPQPVRRKFLTDSIWDWKAQVKLNKFSNQNTIGTSISGAHFINEMASSLMLTASSMSLDVYWVIKLISS